MFRVYLDLGGGSLEVLVDDTLARNNTQGHAGLRHPHVISTSIFFGGACTSARSWARPRATAAARA
jgi:exopolyphosphatase/pppGpp-phosphohydrolase